MPSSSHTQIPRAAVPAEPEGQASDGPFAAGRRLKILVLADRDWTHPQGGGTGANLYGNVIYWARWGHDVTVLAGSYPGAVRDEQVEPNLRVRRAGGRATVFPRGILAVLRGLGRDADVVLEVINGITFLTPLWLRKPTVALVNHPHRDLYIGEFGSRLGRVLSAVLEELPLRLFYRRTPFLTISGSSRDELVEIDGVPGENITVAHCGIDVADVPGGEDRSPEPRLLYVGRLKAYKRIEYLLDAVSAIPGVGLDIAGHGDHGETLDGEVAARGLQDRVRVYGHVDEQIKAELFARAWIHVTASASEGWSLTVMEAAQFGTPSIAMAVGGLRESIVDGETGLLAHDRDEFVDCIRRLVDDAAERRRLGDNARARAATFTWDRTAATSLAVLSERAGVPRA